MNWDVIGATGEWAGAIAVVASLLYLARQIHHATQQAKAAARFSFLDAYNDTNAAIFQSTEVSAIYRAGLAGEITDLNEQTQFACILANFLNSWSVFHDLHEEGELPDNQWEVVVKDIRAIMSTPGAASFWNQMGRQAMNAAFVSAVDALMAEEDPAYQFLPTAQPVHH